MRSLAESFVRDILVDGQMDKLAGYCEGDRYIQHRRLIAGGVSNLTAAFKAWAEAGIVAKYDSIHRVLGEGDFVLVVSEGHFNGEHTSFYDLFMVDNSKIAEHWDIVETIPGKGEWKTRTANTKPPRRSRYVEF